MGIGESISFSLALLNTFQKFFIYILRITEVFITTIEYYIQVQEKSYQS